MATTSNNSTERETPQTENKRSCLFMCCCTARPREEEVDFDKAKEIPKEEDKPVAPEPEPIIDETKYCEENTTPAIPKQDENTAEPSVKIDNEQESCGCGKW